MDSGLSEVDDVDSRPIAEVGRDSNQDIAVVEVVVDDPGGVDLTQSETNFKTEQDQVPVRQKAVLQDTVQGVGSSIGSHKGARLLTDGQQKRCSTGTVQILQEERLSPEHGLRTWSLHELQDRRSTLVPGNQTHLAEGSFADGPLAGDKVTDTFWRQMYGRHDHVSAMISSHQDRPKQTDRRTKLQATKLMHGQVKPKVRFRGNGEFDVSFLKSHVTSQTR